MGEFEWGLCGYVFISAAARDIIGTIDTRRTAEGKALQAAIASMAGIVFGVVNLYIIVHNDLAYLIPEALGSGIGSYLATKMDSRRSRLTFNFCKFRQTVRPEDWVI